MRDIFRSTDDSDGENAAQQSSSADTNALQIITKVAKKRSWVKRVPDTMTVKDYSSYGLGVIKTFQIELDPEGDSVEWKEYNQGKPFITVWIADPSEDVPRFEVGNGPVRFTLTEDSVNNALDEVLESMRIQSDGEKSSSEDTVVFKPCKAQEITPPYANQFLVDNDVEVIGQDGVRMLRLQPDVPPDVPDHVLFRPVRHGM